MARGDNNREDRTNTLATPILLDIWNNLLAGQVIIKTGAKLVPITPWKQRKDG
jgi:hypothetical protein